LKTPVVPAGLWQFQTIPGVETPAYFRMFLRNRQPQFAPIILPKMNTGKETVVPAAFAFSFAFWSFVLA
jgi:hypothetical protein